MNRTLIYIAAVGAAGCTSTGTSPTRADRAAAPQRNDCLRTALVRDWDALDDRNLIVYEGRRPFHVELTPSCFGLDFETMIGLYDRGGDGRICGFGLDRVITDRTIPEDCSVTAVDELTEEQAEELKQRAELARSRR
jgi:hypothetical protein